MKIEALEWDSDFFGINIVRVSSQLVSLGELSICIQELKRASIDLVYLMLAEPLACQSIENVPISLVDEKVTYARKIDPTACTREAVVSQVIPCSPSIDADSLDRLALQSGMHSRFRTDPRIPIGKFEALYCSWIRKSLDGTLAKQILLTTAGNQATGLITVNVNNRIGEIGLVAVDEMQRGRGLGHALMAGALDWFGKQQLSSVQVVTQNANKAACHLYETHGFRLLRKDYIYHLWL
jgi:dTDP-4-amino-4,6-dideoxy-D-galactose acyltransferase